MSFIFKVKYLFILIEFIFITFSVSAQTIDIKGFIVDNISKTKLPYATLILKNQKDSIIRNSVSNENGEFVIKNIVYCDSMYLTTYYMGYKEQTIYFTSNKKSDINIGEVLLLRSNTNLNEFVLEQNVNYVENKFDRKVYTMNDGKIAAAKTVLDLLRILPGVTVDNEGLVRFKGAEATIIVDGQPLNFQFQNIELIPVDMVDKIELIDAAMYSGGNGLGGIINIKFKRVNTENFSGMLSTEINTISFENLDKSKAFLNVNYKKKDLTFFLNTSIENRFTNSNIVISRNVDIPPESSIFKLGAVV